MNTNLLEKVTWSDCKIYVPPVEHGKVIKCYDGDSITVATVLPGSAQVYRFSVRLTGIDTPEMRSKNENEKWAAKFVQQKLEYLLLDKFVSLKDVQWDKYGRLLANVFLDEVNINEWLLDNNYAVPYEGGTKKPPENWKEFVSQI